MAEDLGGDRLLEGLPRDPQGRPVLGRIPLERRIGRGGMGSVYYARHPRLGCEVAVKILPFHLVDEDPTLVERFRTEARTAAMLSSDHVVRVLDVDEDARTHFLVMEYVEGESAGTLLKRRGPLPEREALEIVTAAARGLAAAHAKGIVHRDVKPDNLLIPGGEPSRTKLADLGLARPQGGGASAGTTTQTAMGTPGFMAPEQVKDARSAGPAADVFGMGATLQALLTGQAPFRGASLANVLLSTVQAEPEPLPEGVSARIRSVIARCLAKDPRERYANGAELLSALEGRVGATRPRAAPPPRRARWAPVAALLAVAGAGLLAVFALARGPSPEERAALEAQARAERVAGALAEAAAAEEAWDFARAKSAYERALETDPGHAAAAEALRTMERRRRPERLTLRAGGATFEFVRVKPGRFVMGLAQIGDAPRDVTLTREYWILVTEVTQAQWTAVMGANPAHFRDPGRPVECVTWAEANEYAQRLTQRLRGWRASLPTDAQWEYACRGGMTTLWNWGDDPSLADACAWHRGNSQSETHPVAQKRANALGLYDMHGNVSEWTADWFGPSDGRAASDPTGPDGGSQKILRGGSFDNTVDSLICAFRGRVKPVEKASYVGFRVVAVPEE
jgi:serine/threonine-protein kinase